MAEEKDKKEDKGEGNEKGSKGFLGKKKLLIIIAVVILLAAGGGGFFFMEGKGEDGGDSAPQGEEVKSGDQEGEAMESEVLSLSPFIVNLLDESGTRYLKVSIDVELGGIGAEEAAKRTARIRDSIIILLSSKRYSDVGTVEGKYQLRDEMAARINKVMPKGHVKAVYFTDFVIQ